MEFNVINDGFFLKQFNINWIAQSDARAFGQFRSVAKTMRVPKVKSRTGQWRIQNFQEGDVNSRFGGSNLLFGKIMRKTA